MATLAKRRYRYRSIYTPSPMSMALSYVVLIGWTFLILFPLYWLLVTSFKLPIQGAQGPVYIPFVDFQPSLHAWKYILVGDLSNDTIRVYRNTIVISLTSTALAVVVGSAAAYALARFDYRPRVGAILTFIGCVVLAIVAVVFRAP